MLGCTFWNTADMYGKGANERLIGACVKTWSNGRELMVFAGSVLKESDNRSKVFVVTKFGFRWDEGKEGFSVDCAFFLRLLSGMGADFFEQARRSTRRKLSTLPSSALGLLLTRGRPTGSTRKCAFTLSPCPTSFAADGIGSPIEGTVKAMDELRKAGKTTFIGLSEVSSSR